MEGRRATDNQQDEEIAGIRRDIKELRDILKPISETYTTVSRLGKWAMAALVLFSVVIGILIGLKSLIHRDL